MRKCDLIILIDDEPLVTMINGKIIEKLEIAKKTQSLNNGQEGINFLKALQESNSPPDLIFLDINMPVMNGFEFLKEFHTLPSEFTKNIKVIMLTSSINEEDFKTAKQLGCDSYLTKPLTKEKILNEFIKIYGF